MPYSTYSSLVGRRQQYRRTLSGDVFMEIAAQLV